MAETTTGTVTLAGGNNITLSTGASAITISGPNTHAQQTAISGVIASNATFTSGTVQLVGENNITVHSGANQSILFSGPSTHAQQTGISGVRASDATFTSGTVIISGGNNITVSSGANQSINIHGPNTHAQQTAISGVVASDATFTSGTINIVGENNITVHSGANQSVLLSGPSTHAQQTGISAISGSNASITSGTVSLANANNFSFSVNGQTISGSVHAPETPLNVGVSTGGNTSGDTTVATGSRLVFAGGNNITLSQGTGAAATTITISAPNLAGGGNFSGGASNLGNTAGSTGITGTRLVFVGTNNISLSQSTDANGGTLSISGNATTPSFSGGVSNLGNTAGSTGVTGTRLVFAGTNGINLSQSTDANGGTVSIAQVTASASWVPEQYAEWILDQIGQNSVSFMDWHPQMNFSMSRFNMFVSITNSTSTNSSYAGRLTMDVGLYTRSGSTLNLASSGQATYAWTNTSNNSTTVLNGIKAASGTFAAMAGTPGDYWIAVRSSTSTVNANWFTMSNLFATANSAVFSGVLGAANAASNQLIPGRGTYSATSTALPAAVQFNEITGTYGTAKNNMYMNFVNFTQ